MYLEERHLISWKVLLLFWLYKGLRYRGSLSLRYEGVLLLTILCICIIRIHQRRSDKDSHPNSSYSFERLEPCHAPVIARAAWYWIHSAGSSQIESVLMVYDILCRNSQDGNEQELYTFDQVSYEVRKWKSYSEVLLSHNNFFI